MFVTGGTHKGRYGDYLGDWGTKMVRITFEDEDSGEHHLMARHVAKICPPDVAWSLYKEHEDVAALREIVKELKLGPTECPKCSNAGAAIAAALPCAAEMVKNTFRWIGVSIRGCHYMESPDCFGYQQECRMECIGYYMGAINNDRRLLPHVPPCVTELTYKMYPNGPCKNA